jgi:hypothetical protein
MEQAIVMSGLPDRVREAGAGSSRPPNLAGVRNARPLIARTLRATTLLASDGRLPKPLRWFAAFALLPIPGPVDEAVLLLLAPILVVFYRQPMREAWLNADD